MAADAKAQAIYDASSGVIDVARRFRNLAKKVLHPVVEDVEPHAETVTSLKVKAGALFEEWDEAKAALDAERPPE